MLKEVRNGRLYFDGVDTVTLAEKYGTPLYVMSRTEIENRIDEDKDVFHKNYPKGRVAYASKAFCTKAMYKLCEKKKINIDVVSGGELYAAIEAGFPAERIEFNGNNKLISEIEDAVEYGIGRFIVDNISEISMIDKICESKNKTANILLRITPGIAASTHDYIVTGKKDSKFGFPPEEEIIFDVVEKILNAKKLHFMGFHFHIGSQITEKEPYLQSLAIILKYVKKIKEKFNVSIEELNLGGGFSATYINDERKSISYYMIPMIDEIKKKFGEMKIDLPNIVIEPGRSIVAEAGITLYTIGCMKEIKGVRKYISIDGGMSDNLRPALYQSEYKGIVANKAEERECDLVTICGKCCESGDFLIKDIKVPKSVGAGDIYAIYSTGAYGYSMASNYNNNPIPAVVLVHKGNSEIIVKRQSYSQIIENNIIPESLI